jgi:Mg-chelatase subunit ChlD
MYSFFAHMNIPQLSKFSKVFLLVSFLFTLFVVTPNFASASSCEDGTGTTAKVSGRVWETINYGSPATSKGVKGVTVRITRGDSTSAAPRYVDVQTGTRMELNPKGSSPQQGATLRKISDTYRPTDPQGPNDGIYDLCGFILDADVHGAHDIRTQFTVSVIGAPTGYSITSAGTVFPPEYSLARNTPDIGWTQDYITGRNTLVNVNSYTNQKASTKGRAFGTKTSCNDFAPSIPGIGNPETKYRCDFKISKQAANQTEITGRVVTLNATGAVSEYWQSTSGICGAYSYKAGMKVSVLAKSSGLVSKTSTLNNCNPQPFYNTGKIGAGSYELSLPSAEIPVGYSCATWGYSRYNNSTAKWETVATGSGCTVPTRIYGVQPANYHNSHHVWFHLRKNTQTPSTRLTPTITRAITKTITPTRRLTTTPTRVATTTQTPISLSCTINDNGHAATVVSNDKVTARVVPVVSGATTQQLTYAWTSLAFKDSIVTDTSPLRIGTLSAPTAQSTVWTAPLTLPQDKNKVLLRATVTATNAGRVARATCEKVYGILGNCSQPVDVMFVIDRSGSMISKQTNGRTKFDDAKAAAIAFIDTMKTTYAGRNGGVRVGFVAFGRTLSSTQSTTVALSTNLDDVKSRILALNKDESGTCIECGLSVANQNLSTTNPKGAAQKIAIVLSDGRANRSVASNGRDINEAAIQPALDMAQSGKDAGYAYFVVGFSSSGYPEMPCTTRGYTTDDEAEVDCQNTPGIAGYNDMPKEEVDSFYRQSSLDSSSQWAELFKRFKETVCANPALQAVLGESTEQVAEVSTFQKVKSYILKMFGY